MTSLSLTNSERALLAILEQALRELLLGVMNCKTSDDFDLVLYHVNQLPAEVKRRAEESSVARALERASLRMEKLRK
jgi:hypothetical protein